MTARPHLFFQNESEGVTIFRQKTRYAGRADEENEEEKDYTPKREDFIRSIEGFYYDRKIRDSNRNSKLEVPANVEYIKIIFHDVFDSSFFENRYRLNFGLSPIYYTEFNTVGLFAIIDYNGFENFIKQLQIFIDTRDHLSPEYNTDIKYIKEFLFYSTEQIIQYKDFQNHATINLVDNVELFEKTLNPIEESLHKYLSDRGISYYSDATNNKIEIGDIDESIIKEIADNFDIIQSINSFVAGYVTPSVFNLPEKSFGFSISNTNENLPIIGIIDTGISEETPLNGLIINADNTLNLTSSNVKIDETNHGTAVAALAALGERLYPNHIGTFDADAKLLSIKTLIGDSGFVPESEVVRLIRQAHEQYNVQIFTLTIGYIAYKKNNEDFSSYAYALDKLAYELNILIFISTGNNNELTFFDGTHFKAVSYPRHFSDECSNLCSPAESLNNITVGAAASNFENNDELRISPVGHVPAIYSRTSHINWMHSSQFNKNGGINWFRANKKLFKPDICSNGGDFDVELLPTTTGLKVVSTEKGIFFDRSVGTSFSAPLAANLAAKLLRTYPRLGNNMQTVKALIINSADDKGTGDAFNSLEDISPTAILGNGVPDSDYCQYSNDNRVTIILEGEIKADEIKCYPINIPEYLLHVDRTNNLLKVKATLCFKFEPLKHHFLAYCPIHLAFGVFRNLPLQEYLKDEKGNLIKDENDKSIAIGINDNKTANFVFDESWSQDYYYKAKMLSNCQKISFSISKKVLLEERCTLKISVNSRLHKLLSDLDRSRLIAKNINFSIVFTIEETPVKNTNTNRLYNELTAINHLEAISTLEAQLEL